MATVCIAVAAAGCGSESAGSAGGSAASADAADGALASDVAGSGGDGGGSDAAASGSDADAGARGADAGSADVAETDDAADGGDAPEPDTHAPDGEAPDTLTPDTFTPDAEVPDSSAPDGGDPDTNAPDSEAPDASAPDSEAPDTSAPDSEAPDASAPDSEAPDASADSASDAGPPPCLPTAPTTEVCDGLDNDCDGTTDVVSENATPLCADGNSCTADTCAGTQGCTFPPLPGGKTPPKCDDGDPCTKGESCAAGVCQGPQPACVDGNPCTTDACDAKDGSCSYAPIAGCKTCKVVADCADGNDCSKDACDAAKGTCSWTPITGCIGPTDPFVSALTLAAATLQAPGGVTAKLWVENLGKPIIYGGANGLKIEYYYSKDGAIDAGDTKWTTQTWSNKAIGMPSIPKSYMDIAFSFEDLAKATPGKQHVCVRLIGGGDVNPANNDACAPIDVIFPAWKLVSLQVPGGEIFNKQEINVTVKAHNGATTDQKLPLAVYLSADGVWDDKDTQLLPGYDNPGIGVGTVKAGADATFSPKATIPVKAAPGKPWLCVVLAPASYKYEEIKDDNIACKQLDSLRNPIDVALSANNVGFVVPGATLAFVGNPVYGQPYQCMIKQIVNFGDMPLQGKLAARCWLDAGAQAYPGAGGWSLDFSIAADIAAGYWQNNAQQPGTQNNIISAVGAELGLFRPNHLGISYVCAHLNHDSAFDEVVIKNNKVCMKINITGHDLYPDPPWIFLGTKPGAGQKFKRGVDLPLQFRVCNKGNATLKSSTKLQKRIWLSTDAALSPDDVLIYDVPGINGYTDIPGATQYAPGCANLGYQDKVKLADTIKPGTYLMLVEVNGNQVYPDPQDNNFAVGVSVVVE